MRFVPSHQKHTDRGGGENDSLGIKNNTRGVHIGSKIREARGEGGGFGEGAGRCSSGNWQCVVHFEPWTTERCSQTVTPRAASRSYRTRCRAPSTPRPWPDVPGSPASASAGKWHRTLNDPAEDDRKRGSDHIPRTTLYWTVIEPFSSNYNSSWLFIQIWNVMDKM